jgi:hypothetical protein
MALLDCNLRFKNPLGFLIGEFKTCSFLETMPNLFINPVANAIDFFDSNFFEHSNDEDQLAPHFFNSVGNTLREVADEPTIENITQLQEFLDELNGGISDTVRSVEQCVELDDAKYHLREAINTLRSRVVGMNIEGGRRSSRQSIRRSRRSSRRSSRQSRRSRRLRKA